MSTTDHNPWRIDAIFEDTTGLAWCEECLDFYDLSKLSRLPVRDGSSPRQFAALQEQRAEKARGTVGKVTAGNWGR